MKIAGIPGDTALLWDLAKDSEHDTGVCIDERWVNAEVKRTWEDFRYHSKGVSYKIKYKDTIIPNQSKHVLLKNKCIFDTYDYMVRKFSSYGKDAEVIVNKPENIEIFVSWLLTARGKKPETVIRPAETSPTSYVQRVEGFLVPGNGFIVMWWPKRRNRKAKKRGGS